MTFSHDPLDRPPLPGPDAPTPTWVEEVVVAVRPSLTLAQEATPHRIAGMRRGFAAWLAVDVAAGDPFDDLVLAVYEALANVAEHAYADIPDRLGEVALVAHRAAELLRITVVDRGRWRTGPAAPFRHRGLTVIGQLVAQVHVATGLSGTSVHLRTAPAFRRGPSATGFRYGPRPA